MKTFPLRVLLLVAAAAALGGDSTGAGSGGDVMERLLVATRRSLIAVYTRVNQENLSSDLCRCQPPLADVHCQALQQLTEAQASYCGEFLLRTAREALWLNRPGAEVPFRVVYDPIHVVEGGVTKQVRAATQLGPRGEIRFHYASTQSLWPAAMVALTAHEMGHKVEFLGHYIDDGPAVGPFAFPGGGRALLDAVGSAMAIYAMRHGLVSQFQGVEDWYSCHIQANGQPFSSNGRSPRLFADNTLKRYDSGVGNLPRDFTCQVWEGPDRKSYLTTRLWIHDDADCGPLPPGGSRFTVMELWRVRLAQRGAPIPKPEQLMQGVHGDYSPICKTNDKSLVLSLADAGATYTFELRHAGVGRRHED